MEFCQKHGCGLLKALTSCESISNAPFIRVSRFIPFNPISMYN